MSEDTSTGHRIPAALLPEPEQAPPPAAVPSNAERARTIAALASRAALATVAADPAGFPFASALNIAVDDAGRPLTFVSTMAEHTRNLAGDPRASVLLAEEVPDDVDPLARGRVTLIGRLGRLDDPDEVAGARERFLATHPASFYVDYGDFSPYRLDLVAVRYIGGFGRMGWVDPHEYRTAEPDPLRHAAPGAIAHLNADHADALLACARAFAGLPGAAAASVSGLDRYGLDLVAQTPYGSRVARVAFAEPISDPRRLRAAAVDLTRRARAALEG